MPNYCWNTVTVTGTKEKIAEIAKAAEAGAFLEYCAPVGEWDYGKCIETWGTKWEADIQDVNVDEDTIDLNFNTAWSPPIEAYEALLEQDGVDNVYATYIEEGCDFAGVYDSGNDMCVSISEAVEKIIADEELDLAEVLVADEFDHFEYQVEYRMEQMEEEEEDE